MIVRLGHGCTVALKDRISAGISQIEGQTADCRQIDLADPVDLDPCRGLEVPQVMGQLTIARRRRAMDPAAAPFSPEQLLEAEARAARVAAFYSDSSDDEDTGASGSEATSSDGADVIWAPQAWTPPAEAAPSGSPGGWGSGIAIPASGGGGWGGEWGGGGIAGGDGGGPVTAAAQGAWAKGIGSPPSPHGDLIAAAWNAAPPSARLLGYAGDRVEAGLPPPLSAERCWCELDSPEQRAAVALLGSTEGSWDADHSAASGARVELRLETVRQQIGMTLQPAWWEAMGGSDSDSPSRPARVRRVRIGEDGHTPRSVREIDLTPLSIRRQNQWRPNWSHSDSDEDESDDDDDVQAAQTAAQQADTAAAGEHAAGAWAGAPDPDSPELPTVPASVSPQPCDAAAGAGAGADSQGGRLSRLRSYEFGEYRLAQEVDEQRPRRGGGGAAGAAGGSGKTTDAVDSGSPSGMAQNQWKDLGATDWERKQKHKQKHRAARAIRETKAAEGADEASSTGGSVERRRRKIARETDRRGLGGQSGAKGRRGSSGSRKAQRRRSKDQADAAAGAADASASADADADVDANAGDDAQDDDELDEVHAQIALLKAELNLA